MLSPRRVPTSYCDRTAGRVRVHFEMSLQQRVTEIQRRRVADSVQRAEVQCLYAQREVQYAELRLSQQKIEVRLILLDQDLAKRTRLCRRNRQAQVGYQLAGQILGAYLDMGPDLPALP